MVSWHIKMLLKHNDENIFITYNQSLHWLQDKAISIWESKNFFMDLEPLPGGVEAVKEMSKMEK